MAWDHLSVNRPHLVYIILGGFTTIFMLCSSIIKEKLYIGEATVATICGIIFGPHAANLINPLDWGNTDQITLEFSRIVLVVQCFAVGVELPKAYMERHWKSVTLLLIPVMTFGWLVTSLFIWWLFRARLDWLDSLCVAACVTATDPVLASSVVGKGKFAKRVPKHLRDLLSAESGCNDGMAFPFVYLAVYLIRYRPDAGKVTYHWMCYSVLYECIFGAVYGVLIGYFARRAIRYAHEKDFIDRESFLVFYFVLALWCAGSGSILGLDDLLVGFACGVGFSNDGWFQEKTEESHVSNVIDLLINLAFFVYFGTIVPWDQFNSDVLGISPWRLVVLGIFVLFFRRIPVMLALKPIMPEFTTWREALFAGHFGPIGVGGLFVAILARAELETESTTPLAVIPEPGFPHLNVIELIWPITTFLVIVSIVVHGSSIAVFTLGRHINTLAISVSFSKAPDDGPTWMDRLPRIQSRSRSSMSLTRPDDTESSFDEKLEEGVLSPSGMPKNFLRRQKEGDGPAKAAKRRSRKKWDAGIGPGGPVSQSAIKPAPRYNADHLDVPENNRSESETLVMNSDESPDSDKRRAEEPEMEIYREGSHDVIEDEEGNVLDVRDSRQGESEQERNRRLTQEGRQLMQEKSVEHGVSQEEHALDEKTAGERIAQEMEEAAASPSRPPLNTQSTWRDKTMKMTGMSGLSGLMKKEETPKAERKHGPALAYQFGNTIIVEDEDGEVIKKYDIPQAKRPGQERKASFLDPNTRRRLDRMGSWMGIGHHGAVEDPEAGAATQDSEKNADDKKEAEIRFTVGSGGRRLSKADFIQAVARLDPKSRQRMLDSSNASEEVRNEANSAAASRSTSPTRHSQHRPAEVQRVPTATDRPSGPGGFTLVDSNDDDIPFHPVSDTLARFKMGGSSSSETAAQRRRRQASQGIAEEDEEDEEEEEDPRGRAPRQADIEASTSSSPTTTTRPRTNTNTQTETAAERKRRLAALGGGGDDQDSSSDEEGPGAGSGFREIKAKEAGPQQGQQGQKGPSIRFADPTRPQAQQEGQGQVEDTTAERGSSRRLRWGANVGKKPAVVKK